MEENVGESSDPAFVIGQFADHLRAERFHPTPLFLGIDDLVKVEDVSKGVATLLPRFKLMISTLDRVRRQAANIVRQTIEKMLGLAHRTPPTVTGITPIMASRVTSAASCSSL